MATWQQGINSGGFLAGIGTQNENAPKASDVNATLGLIRENNELARSGANNVGLTALRGLAGVADIYKQEQQQKAISAFNKVHADAWASGDPSGLFKFAKENPAFVAQAQQAFSGLNEQQRNDMGDLAMRANVALSQGPEAYSKFITDNKDRLNRVGANADWMIQTGIQNPEQLSHMLTTMTLGAVGPDKMLDYQDKMIGRQQEQQKINETIRNNDMTNARAIRGQNISAANSAADRELQKLLLQQKVISNRLDQAKTEAEISNLNMKLQENQQKQQDVQQQKQMSLGYAAEAATLAREIASDDSLGNITGSISSRIPTFQDSSQDLINKASRLQSLLTQDNLKLMSGVLTDRDITFLGNIASGLNITENGIKGSTEGVKKRLNAIASKLDAKLSASGYQPPQQQLSDDDLINKYLGGQ
ncbi:DNA transfer protein [Escherichia coli]|uniref:DNA transfer protein n=1 Tax=Escherichia coli TaxID=562 RepID=UPI0025A561DB|nr:DNA transfer protein [Escherichia coli]WJQ24293.1 DNA transfer protein [Escherichia coli]WJQ61591.1 DNA transfer protein [Escherichia coli]